MLEFRNVDVSVGKTQILKDFSLCLQEGKITAIVGPNGCGKTTLLQTLNGMSNVTAGEIYLDGRDYFAYGLKERATHLSFMPQFRESAPTISVKGLVEHGRFPYMGFSRKMGEEDRKAVEDALAYVSLSDYRTQMVSELSGGMQQRAYLAMQLAQNSPYMILDEPMNHLDFPGQREMYGLIERLGRAGRTIVIVLHDLNQALQIADQIVVMDNRKLCFQGSVEECLKAGIIQEVFHCSVQFMEIDGKRHYVFM